jgi:hypothetical protein
LVSGVRIKGITEATIGNSLMALTVTAIADWMTVAPEPSVVMTMIWADQDGAQQRPAQAEMRVMRERTDAEIGRKQHGRQDRGRDRFESLPEGAERAVPLR